MVELGQILAGFFEDIAEYLFCFCCGADKWVYGKLNQRAA